MSRFLFGRAVSSIPLLTMEQEQVVPRGRFDQEDRTREHEIKKQRQVST